MSDIPTDDDPCDNIDLATLTGWIHSNDSSGNGKADNRQELERSGQSRHTNLWFGFGNS